jgi:hypothetical protein
MNWLRWLRRVAFWCGGCIALTWHHLVPVLIGLVVIVLEFWGVLGCDGLRRVGLLLQVVGFGFVAKGLIDVVQLFDEHSPRKRLRDHLKAFPRPPGKGQMIAAAVGIRSRYSVG